MQRMKEAFHHLYHKLPARSISQVPLTLKRRGRHSEWIPGGGGSLESSWSLSTPLPLVIQVPPVGNMHLPPLEFSNSLIPLEVQDLVVWSRSSVAEALQGAHEVQLEHSSSLLWTYGTTVTSHLPLRLTRPVVARHGMAAGHTPSQKGRTWRHQGVTVHSISQVSVI